MMPDDLDRLSEMDSRLRAVEQAVVELGVMGKWMRILVFVVAGSLGFDLTGLGVA